MRHQAQRNTYRQYRATVNGALHVNADNTSVAIVTCVWTKHEDVKFRESGIIVLMANL